jgi:hypothetical protein
MTKRANDGHAVIQRIKAEKYQKRNRYSTKEQNICFIPIITTPSFQMPRDIDQQALISELPNKELVIFKHSDISRIIHIFPLASEVKCLNIAE